MLTGQSDRISAAICEDIFFRLERWRPGLEVDPQLTSRLSRRRAEFDDLIKLGLEDDAPGAPLLWPFQRVGSEWLLRIKKGILADEQAMGKTVQACDALRRANPTHYLIVCTNAKKQDWYSHVAVWAERDDCRTLTGDAEARADLLRDWNRNGGGLICNYTVAGMHVDELRRTNLLIVDEAHKLRNRKTQQADNLRYLAKVSNWVFLLTASPQVNKAIDIWILLSIVDPERFRSYWSFVYRFCETSNDGYGIKVGDTKPDEAERLDAILNDYCLRRPRSLVPGLPTIRRRVVRHEMTGMQEKLYRKVEEEHQVIYQDEQLDAHETLSRMTRLRQLAQDPRLIFSGYDGPSKIDTLLEDMHGMQSQAVVFTNYAEMAKLAATRLCQVGIIAEPFTGALTDPGRDAMIDRFRQGYTRVLVLTHGTGGEGLNLMEANRAYFLELAWHPAGNKHAQERIARPGQKSPEVEIIVIHTENSIEDDVWEIIKNKERVTLARLAKGRA